MQLNRDFNCFFQNGYQFGCFVRKQKTCHVFDTDGVCTHVLNVFCHLCPVIQGVSITQGVRQCYLCMSFFFVCCFDCGLQVTQVIHTVKDTDDIDTVCDGFLYEIFYHIICIWTVSQDVLSTEQHLQFCVFESGTEFTKSFPWIFFQET